MASMEDYGAVMKQDTETLALLRNRRLIRDTQLLKI